MATIETNQSVIERATEVIFETTPPYVGQYEGSKVDVFVLNNTIKTTFNTAIAQAVPLQESPLVTLFSADLFRRRIFSASDAITDELYAEQMPAFLRLLSATKEQTSQPLLSMGIVSHIGYAAFTNVILRPEGLEIPPVERKLHSSDLGAFGKTPMAESFRFRHNYLVDIAKQAVWSPTLERALDIYITRDGSPDINRFADHLREKPYLVKGRTIEAMTKLSIANMAQHVLVLDYIDPREAEALKSDYIMRGFGIIDSNEHMQTYGEEFLTVHIGERVMRHVLSGDERGGGHHLPSLDSRFIRIVGPIEYIKESTPSGGTIEIPIARKQYYNRQGKLREDTVSSFYPVGWTKDDVLNAIRRPVRYMYGREMPDKSEDFVMSNGLLIKRIYEDISDDEPGELITAFPSVGISEKTKRRLMS